jgi:hypothetical protein
MSVPTQKVNKVALKRSLLSRGGGAIIQKPPTYCNTVKYLNALISPVAVLNARYFLISSGKFPRREDI